MFVSVDPLQFEYPYYTPYQYAGNKPISYIDLDGAEPFPNPLEQAKNQLEGLWNYTIDKIKSLNPFKSKEKEIEKIKTESDHELKIVTETNSGSELAWIKLATSQLGQTEIRGSEHNPIIIDYHATTTGKFKDDETPWCSSFVNWVFTNSEIKGTNSARALSWKDWGDSLESPAYGSVGVINYGNGTGHVGFVVGVTSDDKIVLLGGNQGNKVKYSTYPRSLFEKFVYPADQDPNYNLPEININNQDSNNSTR